MPDESEAKAIPTRIEVDLNQSEKTAIKILQELKPEHWEAIRDQWGVRKPIAIEYLYPSSATPDVNEMPASHRAKFEKTRVAPTALTANTGYLFNLFHNLSTHVGVKIPLAAEYFAGAFATTFRLTSTKAVREKLETHGPDNFWRDRIETEAKNGREDGLVGLDSVHEMSLAIQFPEKQAPAVEAGRTYLAKTYQEYLQNQLLLGNHPGSERKKILELAAKLEEKYGPISTKESDHTHNWGEYIANGEWVRDANPTNNTVRIIDTENASFAEVNLAEYLLGQITQSEFQLLEKCRTPRENPPLVTITHQKEAQIQRGFASNEPLGQDRKRLWEKFKAQEGLRGWQLNFGLNENGQISLVVGNFAHDFGEAKEAKLLLGAIASQAGNEDGFVYRPEYKNKRHDIKYQAQGTAPLTDSAFGIKDGDPLTGAKLDQEVRKLLGIGSVIVQTEIPPELAQETRATNKLLTQALQTRGVTRNGEKQTLLIGKTEQDKCVDFVVSQVSPQQEIPETIKHTLKQVLFESALSIQAMATASQVDYGFSLIPRSKKEQEGEKHTLVCVEPLHQPKSGTPTRLSLTPLGDTSSFRFIQEAVIDASNKVGSGGSMAGVYEEAVEKGMDQARNSGVNLREDILERAKTFYRQVIGAKLVGGNTLAVVSTLSREGGVQQFLEALATITGGNRLAEKLAHSSRQVSSVQVLGKGLFGFVSSLNSTVIDAIGSDNDERSLRHRVKTADFVKAYSRFFSNPEGVTNFLFLKKNAPLGSEIPTSLDEKSTPVIVQTLHEMAGGEGEVGDRVKQILQGIRNEVVTATVREAVRLCEGEIAYGKTIRHLFSG